MMVRRILLTTILTFAILIGKSQNLNVIVPTYADTCNKLIEVPIKVTNFNNLLALQFSIGWDNTKLNFVGVGSYGPASMSLSSGNFGLTNASTGIASFSWNDATMSGISLSDSTNIFVLKFLITGSNGTKANISIQNNPTNIEAIKNNFQNELITTVAGEVNITCPSANFLQLIAPVINEECSKIVEVPIRAIHFKDLVSTQFTLKWNPLAMGFIDISNYGDPSLSINTNSFGTSSTQNGLLSFSWNDATMQGKTISDTATLFKLRFFTSSTSNAQSQISFTNDLSAVEAINLNLISIPVNLYNSNVTITCGSQQGLNIIAPILSDTCGKTILVPIRATQFSNLLSTQFSIGWDPTKISYQGISNYGNAALNLSNNNFGTSQTSNGKINFSWNDATTQGVSIVDTASLFVLRFNIIGSNLEQSYINILNTPTPIEAINIGLTNTPVFVNNGRVNIICPSPTPLGLVINNVADTCNKTVEIPIKVSNYNNLVSLQFSLSWDPTKLNFASISNYGDASLQLGSSNFGLTNINNGQLTFLWNDPTLNGITLSDSTIIFKARFTLFGNDGDVPLLNIVNTSIPIEAVNKDLVVLPTSITPGRISIRCPQPNELALVIPSSTENCNTDIEVPVSAVQFANLLSLQFSLGWDKSNLNFIGISDYGPAALQLGASNFGTNNANNGTISFSWNDVSMSGKTIADSAILFKLKFTVIGAHGASALITVLNTPVQIEAINTSLLNIPTHAANGNISIVCTNCTSSLEGGTSSITYCAGGTYTLTASPSNATSYEWYRNNTKITNATSSTLVINTTGTYFVKVLNSGGCLSTSNSVIANNFIPPTIAISASSTNGQVCTGSSITLTATGATNYIWQGGITNGVAFTPTQSGTYTVTGTDANGCSNSASKSITVLALPIVTISSNAISSTLCLGQPIILTGNGASSYTWTGGVTNGVAFTPSQTGTYTVTGTDANGCVNSASQLVTIKNLPTISITSIPVVPTICIGENITLTASGGLSYSWTGGVVNGTAFTPSQSGTYSVTALGANGCSATSSTYITVNNLPAPTITISSTPVSPTVCLGEGISLTASGGVSYTWTGGITNGVTFIPSQTTTYTVTGTDANGCKNRSTITVLVKALPNITVTSSPSNATVCAGSEIILTANGASTYSWTGGVTNGVAFTPTQSGTYTVTGTDANGCSNSTSKLVTVNNLPLPTISIASNPFTSTVCIGQNITLTASGASTYSWTGGITNGVAFTPTQSGTYTVTGTDANGCRAVAAKSITVFNLPNIGVTASPSNATVCIGDQITMSGTGGLTYSWQGGVINGVAFTPTQSGTYTLTGTDANGCVNTTNKTITVHTLPTISINSSVASSTICLGDPISLTASGAVLYTWSGGISNGVSFSPATTTAYTVTGTDVNGCVGTASKTVIVNTLPTIGAISSPVSASVCIGGNVLLNGTGGVSYTWSDGVINGQLFTPSQTTTYTVTGTDANGCRNTATKTITVINSPAPTIVINSNPSGNAICIGTSISLSASGGVSYVWQGGVVDGQVFTPTQTATYTVTGTDVNGCSNTTSKTITVNAIPTITASLTSNANICAGDNITLSGGGGTSYSWSGGITNGVAFAASQSGTYTVTGTDVNGCVGTASKTVIVNTLPTIGAISSPVSASVCIGGNVLLNGTGGVSYTWSDGVINGQLFTPSQTTTYTVTGTDANGCRNTATKTITVINSPAPTIVINSNPSGNAICIGTSISLSASGGVSYVWQGGVVDGQVFTPTQTATYTVTGTDVNGCSNTTSKTITVNAIPTITGSLTSNANICAGDNITLSGGGGTSYSWSGGITNGVAFAASQSGTYTVTGTGANGCSNTSSINIVVHSLPVITVISNPNPALINLGASIILNASGAQSYQWTGGVTNGVSFVPTQTTRYIVRGFNSFGCSDTSSILVNVNTISVKFVMPEITDSCNKTIELPIKVANFMGIISAQYSVTWDTANLQFVSISNYGTSSLRIAASNFGLTNTANGKLSFSWSDPTLTGINLPDSALFYTLRFIIKGKNGINTNVRISGQPTPIEIIDRNMQTLNTITTDGLVHIKCIDCVVSLQNGKLIDSVCSGIGYSLSANSINGIQYNWYKNGTAFSQTALNTININLPGEYYVRSINRDGCEAISNKLLLNHLPLPTISITSNPINATVCAGANINLTAQGALTYNWTGGIVNAQTFTPTQSGTYTVTGVASNGCSATNSLFVRVIESPVVSITGEKYLCPGGTLILNATTNGNSNQWYLNGAAINGATTTSFIVDKEGVYSFVSTNSQGCYNKYLVADTVQIPSIPNLNFSIDNYCVGNTIKFNNQSTNANPLPLKWTWSFGVNNAISNLNNPSFIYQQAGSYFVSLKSEYLLCPNLTAVYSKKITIEQPSQNEKYNVVYAETNVAKTLNARTGGVSYKWQPGIGINDSTIASPVFKYNLGQTYQISILEKSGCKIVDTAEVVIIKNPDEIIFVPTAFSPNGDGQNDKLAPFFINIKKLVTFSIYNRWGQLLYQTTNSGEGWDGYFNGVPQPLETYIWICEIVDENDRVLKKMGQTVLLR